MKTKFSFNTVGLFTLDNRKMVEFYRDVMGFQTDCNGESWDVRMQMGGISCQSYML